MGRILDFHSYRLSPPRKRIGAKSLRSSKESQAAELLTAAALLLSESSPESARIAWMIQDLRDLVLNCDERKKVRNLDSSLTNLS